MTTGRFLLRSLLYYWRTNLAVLLGVIAGTAVIGGALIVGDSVRSSLRQMTFDRLGKIDHLLTGMRFFREDLTDELAARPGFVKRFSAMAPALVMQGSLTHSVGTGAGTKTTRAGKVHIYAVDRRVWKLTDSGSVPVPRENEIVLSRRVADQLSVKTGDDLSLVVELPSTIPRDALLGVRDDVSRELSLKVAAILEENSGVGRLALRPNQQSPLNAFLSLKTLQSSLDMDAMPRSRAFPQGRPARVNTLFVQAREQTDRQGISATDAARTLTDLLKRSWKLPDLGLRVVQNETHRYLSLESEQQILPDLFSEAGRQAADKLVLKQSPVLVYLGNEFANIKTPKRVSMYSVIAGLDISSPSAQSPPFGPFSFVGTPPKGPLGNGEIVLNEWLANDVNAGVGDVISITYHIVGSHGELPEEERRFTIRGIVKLDGTVADDRGLVPVVKGITDADDFADWNQPFPMKLPVPKRDEEYWKKYRATPKAFVSLATARSLWGSRYGSLTSLRVSTLKNKSLKETRTAFVGELLGQIDPSASGLVFQPVKWSGLQAAGGTTDFSGLFIGFSFFLILSATILIGLLFRLGIEQRSRSVGLLSAVGFSPRQIRRQFLSEGFLVVSVGGVLGMVAAIGYARLMVYGLTTWWNKAIGTRFLEVHLTPMSLGAGFVISVLVSAGAVWWGMRQLRGLSTRELLSGATDAASSVWAQQRRGRCAGWVGLGGAMLAGLLVGISLVGLVPDSEAFGGLSWRVVAFFVSGIALLTAGLAFLSAWIDSDRVVAVRGAGWVGLGRLGIRNAARHRQRSVLTVGLIASATFVIVAIAAGHRNPAVERPEKHSGNGGFTLLAESSTPLLYDLGSRAGREKLDLPSGIDSVGVDSAGGKSAGGKPAESRLLDQMRVMAFRVQPGEEASCLNIYQTRLPTILGVPQKMIERGGFAFIGAKESNPWTVLNREYEDGSIPVLGDMNTLQYSLHKGVGDVIAVPDDEHSRATLKVAGMLDGSVFQGVLLMSEERFRKLFPERQGYEYFLIEVPPTDAERLRTVLESGLSPYGFDVEPVSRRLAEFLAVQNTYLSTFQTLGGLGLLLGTFGLATVMLRNVLERRAELALLRAVGFRDGRVAWLVFGENAFLLAWGLACGSVSALVAMTPHLTSIGADIPWNAVVFILAGVFTVGMVAALLAVVAAVRTPILVTLRAE